MLGLFLVLPVFMLMAAEVPGYTPTLAGLAIGVYGLSQALLQQPFGRLSDRWGRRRVILVGLALFALGGALAALADSMTELILGRALQGCGAIAGVTLAFAADHTHPARRPVIMAVIGIGIGASFLVSIMLSVPLATALGLSGLFWLTSALGAAGMLIVLLTPGGKPIRAEVLHESNAIAGIWPLCASVFLLHAVMTLFFVVVPGSLVKSYGFELADHWKIYVPTMLTSVVLVFPLLRRVSSHETERRALPWAFAVLAVTLAMYSRPLAMPALLAVTTAYFLAFNLLEAAMPSMVSRMSGVAGRGSRMGAYTTFQFLGAFAGGSFGGWLLASGGDHGALLTAALICAAWALAGTRIFLAGNAASA
jgi:MFS family permease